MLLWLWTVSAWAAPRGLTLEEVVEAAVRLDPDVRLARAEAGVRRGAALASLGAFDPVLGAHALLTSAEDSGFLNGFPYTGSTNSMDSGLDVGMLLPIGTTVSLAAGLDRLSSRFTTDLGIGVSDTTTLSWKSALELSVTQPLLRGAGLAETLADVRLTRERSTAADSLAAAAEATAAADAEALYWSWVQAVAWARILDDGAGVAAETLRMSEAWKGAGRVSAAEHARYAAADATARAASASAIAALRPAADAVLMAMGEAPGGDVSPLTEPRAVAHVDVDAGAARAAALARSPEVVAAEARVEGARADLRATRVGVLPRVDLVAAGGAGALSPSAGGAVGGLAGAEAFPHITGGAVASMPLGNRDARGRRDRAEAELARFEAERDQARARVLGTVSAAVEALAAAEERARLADLAVGYTAETLAAEEALLQAGRGLARDVLEARAAHASAQAVSVAARVDHAVALARLRAARALP